MKTTPFWTDDFPRPADLPTAELPARVDVAVIGSGYTGLNAAMVTARAGLETAVLEAESMGWGASSRNGGMLNTGLKEDMPTVVKRYGMATGRALWAWALASIDYVAQVVDEEAIDCDFVRSGQAYLAYKPAHFEKFRDMAAWYASHLDYHDMAVVSTDQLQAEIGSHAYHGAIVDTRAAGLHPAKYVFGLAAAAARAGAHLVEQCPVTRIERRGAAFHLTTAQGEVVAARVLLATNGYTTDLVPEIRRGVFPVGSYIITTPPLSATRQAELSPRGRMFFDSKNFLNYFRLTPDGRMLFGGRHNLSPNLDMTESAIMMRRRLVEVFPQLTGTELTHSWSGRLGLTFDLIPHAGRLADGPRQGLYYAYGFAGHGVSIASHLGHEMGHALAGGETLPVLSELDQTRYFFTKYDNLYLPIVSQWFRLLDAIQ